MLVFATGDSELLLWSLRGDERKNKKRKIERELFVGRHKCHS